MRVPHRATASLVAVAAAVTLATACGGTSHGGTAGGTPSGTGTRVTGLPHGSGTVRVLYAGSLVNLMEKHVGPGFGDATGYGYQGQGAGSNQLANQIKGETVQADVFISAAPSADAALEGSGNGDWVGWYATFGSAPLVIAYNPHSRYANDFRTKPWYQVLTESGIKVGRTDPKLDPKGVLTEQALHAAASAYDQPDLADAVAGNATVFPEEELVGRLEAGQLDAGFFYSVEAAPTGLPTVSLGAVKASAEYTVTILRGAPDAAGAAAFVDYLFSAQGQRQLRAQGVVLSTPPKLSGSPSAVPADVRAALTNP
jgi:molybdate/tungstate transport system substrate-binding protein